MIPNLNDVRGMELVPESDVVSYAKRAPPPPSRPHSHGPHSRPKSARPHSKFWMDCLDFEDYMEEMEDFRDSYIYEHIIRIYKRRLHLKGNEIDALGFCLEDIMMEFMPENGEECLQFNSREIYLSLLKQREEIEDCIAEEQENFNDNQNTSAEESQKQQQEDKILIDNLRNKFEQKKNDLRNRIVQMINEMNNAKGETQNQLKNDVENVSSKVDDLKDKLEQIIKKTSEMIKSEEAKQMLEDLKNNLNYDLDKISMDAEIAALLVEDNEETTTETMENMTEALAF
ncbi:hypothetical protein SNEBB_006448 [Seison nebaliae]|nr:hypothetical protein SNEBB_006448 [Seison nebaliae]